VARPPAKGERPLDWVGSSKNDFLAFPEYVLHAFQKKSPSGTRTARGDAEQVERRLKIAQQDYEARYGKRKN
jgi:phage-related protein